MPARQRRLHGRGRRTRCPAPRAKRQRAQRQVQARQGCHFSRQASGAIGACSRRTIRPYHRSKRMRAILQASSPGEQAWQTSGRTAYTAHDVDTPTSPTRALQRFPLQRMRPCRSSTKARGIRSRSASASKANRGQSAENEQHAPQARHTRPASGVIPVVFVMIPEGRRIRRHLETASKASCAAHPGHGKAAPRGGGGRLRR